jgi:molecular chaperone DnaK (HSP70)
MLETFFDNRKLDHRANQDEAVALGAAILANKIKSGDGIETGDDNANPTAELTFQDVTSID